jgi:spermidine/putrescine transport system substrate-binding protein
VTNKFEINRRGVLKGAAAGAVALAAPAIVSSRVLAQSSGEVNFMGWAGYPQLTEKVFPAFTEETGITVNFLEQPDQDAMQAQAKLSLQTGAVDLCEPTVDRIRSWVDNGLVQAWNTDELSMDSYLPGLADGPLGEQATVDGQRMIVLSVWGTEALVYSKADAPMTYGTASLGDLFDPEREGQVCLRAHTGLAAMGRWLEAEGKLPRPWLDGYKDEAAMRQLWDIALAEAIKVKGNVVQFWKGENEAQAAFRTNGATLGLNWDSTGFNLRGDGFGYIAPKEGAFAWNQGFSLMKNAKNVAQAHEFAKWVATPKGAALWAAAFSANPVAKGAIDLASPEVREFYNAAMPGDAVQKLWWWPAQDAWFVALRGEYADKFLAA